MSYHLKRSDSSVQEGVRRIALSQIDSAIADIDDDRLEVHETVHEVRKRCKKLRGLIRLVRPAFGDYQAENAAFRDAANQLSYIRDAEALIETYDDLLDAFDGEVERRTFAPVRRRLTERKKRIAKEKGLDDKLADFRAVMVEARQRAGGWTVNADGVDAIGGGLAKTYRRGEKALARARAEPSAENLHELRKRVKYHRYHANLLRAIWPAVISAHRDQADRMGGLLGDHHNLAVFRPTVLEEEKVLNDEQDSATLADLIERRQAALHGEALTIGLRLFADKPKRLSRRWATYWSVWRDEKAIRRAAMAE